MFLNYAEISLIFHKEKALMHIPQNLLDGSICPMTAVVSGLCLAGAALVAHRSAEKPHPLRFAAVSAFIFAAQMMNFPISGGTSGHLLGGVLASALLGVPFGVLALALVVAIQALVFADGGLTVLGANVLNMAVLGAGLGGLLRLGLLKKLPAGGTRVWTATALASWASGPHTACSQPPTKPTKATTMISGPGVVSPRTRPSIICALLSHWWCSTAPCTT